MKQKINRAIKTILLCGIIFFTACERDALSETDPGSNFRGSAKYISLDEFKITGAFGQFDAIQGKSLKSRAVKSNASKLDYNNEYGFYIDTDRILFIQQGDSQSYTFPIYRPGIENTENLVFNLNENNQYDVYITTYDLNKTDKGQILRNENIDLNDKVTFSRLGTTTGTNSTGRAGTIGTMAIDNPCDGVRVDHIEAVYDKITGEMVGSIIYWVNPCPDGDTGGGGGSSGGDDGGDDGDSGNGGIPTIPTIPTWPTTGGGTPPGSGNGGGSNPGTGGTGGGTSPVTGPSVGGGGGTIITFPVIQDDTAEHLKQLNDITNNSRLAYKAKVTVLQHRLTDTLESGFEFRTNPNGSLQTPIEPLSTPTGVHFDIPLINTLVRIHDHPNNIDPVFSSEDVFYFSEFWAVKDDLNADDRDDITSMLITRTGAFALKVDDPDKLWAFYQDVKYGLGPKNVTKLSLYKDEYLKEVVGFARKECNHACTNDEYNTLLLKYYLQWMSKKDTGLGFYQGTIKSDGTYTWARIRLN